MSIKTVIAVALTFAISPSWPSSDTQQRKPTVEVELRILQREPPPTLAELLNKIDLAVHVNVLSAQPRTRQIPGGSAHVTFYVAEVLDVGRTNRPVRAKEKIRIVQRGGVFQEPDKILRFTEKDNPPLAVGRSYLLTLAWDDTESVYFLAFGSNSVFEISDSTVYPRGRSTAVKELSGKDLKEAIQRIK